MDLVGLIINGSTVTVLLIVTLNISIVEHNLMENENKEELN